TCRKIPRPVTLRRLLLSVGPRPLRVEPPDVSAPAGPRVSLPIRASQSAFTTGRGLNENHNESGWKTPQTLEDSGNSLPRRRDCKGGTASVDRKGSLSSAIRT